MISRFPLPVQHFLLALTTLALVGGAAAWSACGTRQRDLAQAERTAISAAAPAIRHVVVIVGDDHASTVLGAYGNARVRTPHLDRLAARGSIFRNAYANAPICSASRQSMLTGKYPHATGVNLLFTPFDDTRNTTVAEHLQQRGFATALVGKAHFNTWVWAPLYTDGPPQFGFDTLVDRPEYRRWLAAHPPRPVPPDAETYRAEDTADPVAGLNPGARPHAYYDADAEATFLTGAAARFVEASRDRRLFLWLAYHQPHAPFAFPLEYGGRYAAVDMPLPTGSPADNRWVPTVYRDLTEAQRRGIIAAYYTSVEYLDAQVGRVMADLEAAGVLDETLVVYVGDQGYLLNDHRRFEKHTMWREAIQAPLIVAGPGVPQGVTFDELIEFVDLAPTIAEALGVAPVAGAQGRSFWALLQNQPYVPRTDAFAEYLEDNTAMLATARWKYVFASGKRDLGLGYATGRGPAGVTHHLYDLAADPGETRSVAAAHPAVVDSLKALMLGRFAATHPDAARLPQGLTVDGQLVWFCEPRDVGAESGGVPQRVFYGGE